jgi:diguanylate cyclase (GGDEF)-like protein
MQMRNKLLSYFALFVLFTLISFGLITFHLINESAIENDQLLLDKLIKIQSAYLKDSTQRIKSIEQITEDFKHLKEDENHFLLIIDDSAKVIHPAASQLQLQEKISNTTLDSLLKSSADSGYFEEFERTYIWVKSKLEFNNLSALYILEVKRLIVVAIVIFWVGVWGALITSTILTRKIIEQQKKIEYQANHDIMTGLQNRNFLATKIDQIIASHTVPSLSIILIGINRFKEINSTLGHDFGDLLLLEFSKRLQSELWSNDTIARFGSDQYALILPLSNNEHWKIVIEKIQKLLLIPFTIQDIHITSDVSIGVSIFPNDGNTASQLLRCAEVAMHAAKKSGRFYECYETTKDPNSIERLQLIGELSNASELPSPKGEGFKLRLKPI